MNLKSVFFLPDDFVDPESSTEFGLLNRTAEIVVPGLEGTQQMVEIVGLDEQFDAMFSAWKDLSLYADKGLRLDFVPVHPKDGFATTYPT